MLKGLSCIKIARHTREIPVISKFFSTNGKKDINVNTTEKRKIPKKLK